MGPRFPDRLPMALCSFLSVVTATTRRGRRLALPSCPDTSCTAAGWPAQDSPKYHSAIPAVCGDEDAEVLVPHVPSPSAANAPCPRRERGETRWCPVGQVTGKAPRKSRRTLEG